MECSLPNVLNKQSLCSFFNDFSLSQKLVVSCILSILSVGFWIPYLCFELTSILYLEKLEKSCLSLAVGIIHSNYDIYEMQDETSRHKKQ